MMKMPPAGTQVKGKKKGSGRGAGAALALCALAALCALGMYLFQSQAQPGPELSPAPSPTAEPTPTPTPPDTEPPVIEGPHDMTVAVGMTLSYRSGVTAVDAADGKVKLEIDASAVNLSEPGEYPVTYWAVDKAGNRAEATITVTVVAVSGVDDDDPTADVSGEEQPTVELPPIKEVTAEMVDQEADRILGKILSPSMSQWEQAQAIYNYVHTHVKYVGTSDKSSWLMGAYVGFVRGRGDCYNYFACSKALLTRAGIPNVDLYRVGGGTDHYWQLVDVGSGWYHFDACPHPDSYPLNSFLLDEMAVRTYTEKCTPVRSNYYVYDYANCPVVPVGFPVAELPAESELPEEGELPGETPDPGLMDPETGETLLPPGVLSTQAPSELPGEGQPPEGLPSPEPTEATEVEPAQATPEPVPEGTSEPIPVETQVPESMEPSPAPEIDPPVEETPAEFEMEAT